MKTVLRLVAGSILVLGIVAAFATYPTDPPTYLAVDYPRAIPLWVWCVLLSSASCAYLVASRYGAAASSQVRTAAATTFVVSAGAVVYSGDLGHMWTQLVSKLI